MGNLKKIKRCYFILAFYLPFDLYTFSVLEQPHYNVLMVKWSKDAPKQVIYGIDFPLTKR